MERSASVRLGEIEITPVWDGTLDADIASIRGLALDDARRLLDEAAQATGVDPLVLPVRAFLVRTPGALMLVDTGSGTTKGPRMGHLPASLAALGVEPGDISAVVMTHLHLDHAGGLVDGADKAAFSAARLVMHEAEAAYFLDSPTSELDARSQRHAELQRALVAPYRDRVDRVPDGGGVGGLSAWLAPGHTPGHTTWIASSWIASSGGRKLLVLGDVVHLAAVQLPRPQTAMIYDVDPDLASKTRRAVLERAVDEDMLVAGAHLPARGIGTFARDGQGYRFQPVA